MQKQKGFAQFLVLLLLAIVIVTLPLALHLAQTKTNFGSHAAEPSITNTQSDQFGIGPDGKLTDDRAFFLRVGIPSKYKDLEKQNLIEHPDTIQKQYVNFNAPVAQPKNTAQTSHLSSGAGSHTNGFSNTSNQNIISSCGSISDQGNYVLSADLPYYGGTCLSFTNIPQGFTLDCQGHEVRGTDTSIALSITNVQNFSITNCHFTNKVPNLGTNPQNHIELNNTKVVSIENSQGVVKSNTLEGSSFWTSHFDNSTITDNHILTDILFSNNSSNLTITNNQFTSSWIYLTDQDGNGSKNNTITNNTIDGGWPNNSSYSDDGIAFINQDNLTFSNNTISNVSDAGIEGVGTLSNSRITGNTVKHARTTGIGSWFWTSWRNNTIANNIIDASVGDGTGGADMMFQLFYLPWNYNHSLDEAIYFQGNVFQDNKYIAINGVGAPAWVGRYIDSSAIGSTSFFAFGSSDNVTGPNIVNGNIFQDNDFGTQGPVYINPLALASGGTNICHSNIAICEADREAAVDKLALYMMTYHGNYQAFVNPTNNTWIDSLHLSGGFPLMPDPQCHNASNPYAEFNTCYDADKSVNPQTAIIYTALESSQYSTKCQSSKAAYYIWSSVDQHAGVVCIDQNASVWSQGTDKNGGKSYTYLDTTSPLPTPTPRPLPTTTFNKVYNQNLNLYFYTTDPNLEGTTTYGYESKGPCCNLLMNQATGSAPFYRLYNKYTGEHFFTANEGEKNVVLQTKAANYDFVLEGTVGYCYPNQQPNTIPLYRYSNPQNGFHYYTTSDPEDAQARGAGYGNKDGIACYVPQ